MEIAMMIAQAQTMGQMMIAQAQTMGQRNIHESWDCCY
jgi:hypothetical protein